MATYAELEAEPWWDREIVTPELDWLGDELCRRGGQSRDAFGDKGNNEHLNGGHRSQEWIKNSEFCTNRTYTTQSGLSGEQLRHISAADFKPGVWGTTTNRTLVAQQTRGLWDAAKRGELTGVTQVLGTLDGRTPIGLNVVQGTTFTPSSSHLDHWHVTFDRRHMRDSGLMARIANIALGSGGSMFCRLGDAGSENVKTLQLLLNESGANPAVNIDGNYGPQTAEASRQVIGHGDGNNYGYAEYVILHRKHAQANVVSPPGPAGPQGPAGQQGEPGEPGEPGAAAVLAPGAVLRVEAP